MVSTGDFPRELLCDQVRAAQALAAGLSNAIAATTPGSRISVHMKRVLGPKIAEAAELSPSILYADVSRYVVTDPHKAYYRSALPGAEPGGVGPTSWQVRVAGRAGQGEDPELSPVALASLLVPSISPRSMVAAPNEQEPRQRQRRRPRGGGGSSTGGRGDVAVPEEGADRQDDGSDSQSSADRTPTSEGRAPSVPARGSQPRDNSGSTGTKDRSGEEAEPGEMSWYLHIEVRNVGSGLQGLSVASLFNPFGAPVTGAGIVTSTTIRATGLGLPIARLLAILLNGRVGLFDVFRRASPRRSGGRPRRAYAFTAFIFQVPYVEIQSSSDAESPNHAETQPVLEVAVGAVRPVPLSALTPTIPSAGAVGTGRLSPALGRAESLSSRSSLGSAVPRRMPSATTSSPLGHRRESAGQSAEWSAPPA